MKIAGYTFGSVVDGYGVRNVVFSQGCRHRCVGCHNPTTHSFAAGVQVPENDIAEKLVSPFTSGEKPLITISGGDPFYQPTSLEELVRTLKTRYGADIWCYTGFRWEQLASRYGILKYLDVLVDGPFVQDLRTLEVPFVGSSNQRRIDCRRSLAEGSVVLWHAPEERESDLFRGVI